MRFITIILPIIYMCIGLLVGCNNDSTKQRTLFELVPKSHSGIAFSNTIQSTNEFNIYKFQGFYNGAGVALGDVNNDGLIDIYLTANLGSNGLFINKGNFVFEDVTEKAGVGGRKPWSTGVSMVDINADGWMDIYVCNSGNSEVNDRENEFFINNGDGTFTDHAEIMGLADGGYSTQAVFFDFDKDGDLDMYQLNNSYRSSVVSFNLEKNERLERDLEGGDKLYRNDGGVFIDVSEKANIYGSVIGFGLGVTVADIDRDGWQDLYVANDFFERDYLYMNNGDGTFTESLTQYINATSLTSMGVDIADMNGDGYPEIFVNDMLPETNDRFKTSMTFENWDKYQSNVKNDYYHQFTRNTLQVNQGNLNGSLLGFSELGRFSGVEATDWSWSVLLGDFDNSGSRDIYITNGILQDISDQDFIQYLADEEVARMVIKEKGVDYKKLVDLIPSEPIPNYAYSGQTGLHFKNVSKEWGLDLSGSSNGAAYGDLDNDGDLDLVVNNVNQPVSLYRNHTDTRDSVNYLQIRLKGIKGNPSAFGAQVTLKFADKILYTEQNPYRGFLSSGDPNLHFGLGPVEYVDSVMIDWPNGGRTVLSNVAANQLLTLDENQSKPIENRVLERSDLLFQEDSANALTTIQHRENGYIDFDKEALLYQMRSTQGPKLSVSDVNADGKNDIFIGGAQGEPGTLFIRSGKGYERSGQSVLEADRNSEDVNSMFFDADGDGDQDLYVVSGGSEFGSSSFSLVDRLYVNDGKGNFSKSPQSLPVAKPHNTSTVQASDIDGDGDLDLFVGTRMDNNAFGVPTGSFLLENNGKGTFSNVTYKLAKGLEDLGMVTDALWEDIDLDLDDDLIIVGEWMGIKVFENDGGQLTDISDRLGLDGSSGWWNTLAKGDFNKDGRPDFIIGNHGLNSRFRASSDKPLVCYVNDFDGNGHIEQLICQFDGDKQYPMVLRHDLVSQLPHLKKQILKYADYKGKTIQDLFPQDVLETSVVHRANMFESVVMLSQGKGYRLIPLPDQAQYSPVYAICISDMDGDGNEDVVLGGNLYGVKPEVGRFDASYGTFLKGDGYGNFKAVPNNQTGLVLKGQIRDLKLIKTSDERILVVARNDDSPQVFVLNQLNSKNDEEN